MNNVHVGNQIVVGDCAVKLTLEFGGMKFGEMKEERMVCEEVIAAQLILETASLPPTSWTRDKDPPGRISIKDEDIYIF